MKANNISGFIAEYFRKNCGTVASSGFIGFIEDIVYNLNDNQSVVISGYDSQIKNYSIDAAAYALSLFSKIIFSKHYVTVDANDFNYLMGELENKGWRKGMI